MKENIVAKRYAKAVSDVIKGKVSIDRFASDLRTISGMIEASRELKNIFYNPAIAIKFKEGILSSLIDRVNPDPVVRNFLFLILRKNRIKYINRITVALEELSDRIMNRVRVKIKTAFKLDEKEVEVIKNRFAEATNRDAILDIQVDTELIGGIVAQIGSTVLDGSIKNQLRYFDKARKL
ncbi:MAG: ATP synthase F1 subunit delta [Nitrospinae bacterium]|nr:ATP synthase F1 subunit delta [Nitrospinota bacterium]